jgi:hypothetical protein
MIGYSKLDGTSHGGHRESCVPYRAVMNSKKVAPKAKVKVIAVFAPLEEPLRPTAAK